MTYALTMHRIGGLPKPVITITLPELLGCLNSNGARGFSHWKCERLLRTKFEDLTDNDQ